MFFEIPTQVKFYDVGDKHYVGGITYHKEIICGCCGGVFDIEEIISDAKEDGIKNPITALRWVDISTEIVGE